MESYIRTPEETVSEVKRTQNAREEKGQLLICRVGSKANYVRSTSKVRRFNSS